MIHDRLYVDVHRHAEEGGRKEIEYPRNQKTLVCLCVCVCGGRGYEAVEDVCVWRERV